MRLLCLLLFCALPVMLRAQTDSFTVYFFLLEDCKITQAYTDKMQEIYREYAGDSIGFVGYFPNPVSEDSTVRAFQEKYTLPFRCTRAEAYSQARAFGVQITPEVVVYNETRKTLLYQGRIDNMYERVGQRRRVVTSHELAAALHAIRQAQPVPIPKTNAVGCFFR